MKGTAKMQSEMEGKNKQMESLHVKRLYLESYNRRENLKFLVSRRGK